MSASEVYLPRNRRAVPTSTRLNTRRVPLAGYVAALLLLPALVIAGSMAVGWWSTTGRTLPAASGTGTAGSPARGAGDGAGQGAATPATPADVRGSTTVEQVVAAFPPVSAAEVLAAFGAPPDTPSSTQLKTLVEAGSGVELPAFRTWLEQRPAR